MPRQVLRDWIGRLKPSVDKITRNPWVVKYVPALSDPDLSARLVAFREAQTSKILAHPDPSAD